MSSNDSELDAMIREALDAEDSELLTRFGEEPGYFAQARGLFRGKLAWVMWLAYVVNILAVVVAIWGIWKMFQTTDPVMTIRWAVLILASQSIGLFMKSGLGYQMMTSRVLREVKRLELQILRDKARSEN
jgi:hypothetical protein